MSLMSNILGDVKRTLLSFFVLKIKSYDGFNIQS